MREGGPLGVLDAAFISQELAKGRPYKISIQSMARRTLLIIEYQDRDGATAGPLKTVLEGIGIRPGPGARGPIREILEGGPHPWRTIATAVRQALRTGEYAKATSDGDPRYT